MEIPYFTSEKIKFQLVMCAAGNAICLVRTGALAQKIIRKSDSGQARAWALQKALADSLSASVSQGLQGSGDAFSPA